MTCFKLWLAGLTGLAILLCAGAAGARTQATGFTYYPGFVQKRAVVEAATDKGLIVESYPQILVTA